MLKTDNNVSGSHWKALLFINGEPPGSLALDCSGYKMVACTDGAYTYLKDSNVPLNYLIGDFDSVDLSEVKLGVTVIETPDQNKTDFHKAIEFLIEKGITHLDVYGANGKEQDHFIGNLSTALQFKDLLSLYFWDDVYCYYFIPKSVQLRTEIGKKVSIIPFPFATNIRTKGLEYPLENESLVFGKRIGSRNKTIGSELSIDYETGELLLFIER